MTTMKTTVRNGRIDVPAPNDLPEGTEVILTIGASVSDTEPVSSGEIARVLAAMRQLEPFEIPSEVVADLDAWEQKVNQHGIDRADRGIEQVFP